MVIAKVEIGHVGMLVLRVEAQELREPEISIAVAQPLGTHGTVEGGLAGHLGIHTRPLGSKPVEQILCRRIFFLLIQIHRLPVEAAHSLFRRRFLGKNRLHSHH